jgi:Na+/H+-dicarboxylate symporter
LLHTLFERHFMRSIPLHAQILTGMVLGFGWGFAAVLLDSLESLPDYISFTEITLDFIKPFGDIFINLLKLVAIPLVLTSLIVGVSSLDDVAKLSKMGGKTIGMYLLTTAIAVTVGLVVVNLMEPGAYFSDELRQSLSNQYSGEVSEKLSNVEKQREKGPLAPLVDIVPQNLFGAMADNGSMLQVVFFAVFFGVCLVLIPEDKRRPVVRAFEGFNSVILKMIEIIMKAAPLGVFALLAALIADFAGKTSTALELLGGLGLYALTVLIALAIMIVLVYPLVLRLTTKVPALRLLKAIGPAQMVAFSTSSSAATLPVTMERCEKKLGVSEEVSSFVLPLGATINMDGTSLYQSVAAVFIAQAFGLDLSIGQQLTIVLTATLASIGAAGVPGAGIIMLVIVLKSVGLDPAGIALILAVDRPLDMCRTMVNVTGDATVASIVASSENQLHTPQKAAPEAVEKPLV